LPPNRHPVGGLFDGRSAGFDRKSAWELGVSTWPNDEKNFNLYFDDIAFK